MLVDRHEGVDQAQADFIVVWVVGVEVHIPVPPHHRGVEVGVAAACGNPVQIRLDPILEGLLALVQRPLGTLRTQIHQNDVTVVLPTPWQRLEFQSLGNCLLYAWHFYKSGVLQKLYTEYRVCVGRQTSQDVLCNFWMWGDFCGKGRWNFYSIPWLLARVSF